jgi:hypothetical protein
LQVEGHEGSVWARKYLKVHWLSNPTKNLFRTHSWSMMVVFTSMAGSTGGINNLAKKGQSMLERIGKASDTVYQRKLLAA